MWERINKYVYFVCFLLSDAWFWYVFHNKFLPGKNIDDLPWEQAIVALGFLGGLIYEEIKDLRKSEESDIALLKEFLDTLPYKGSIAFIENYDMTGLPFNPEKLEDLRTFYYQWNDAAHEFLDKKIEEKRKLLWNWVEKYIKSLSANTCLTDQGSQTVPPEWEIERPEFYKQVIEEFHLQTKKIVNAHQDFVRYARKKLKV